MFENKVPIGTGGYQTKNCRRMSHGADANSDDQDWFDKDEDEIVQDLQAKMSIGSTGNSPAVAQAEGGHAIEYISGPTAIDEYLKEKTLQASAAATATNNASVPRLGTADLRKIAQLPPLDAFLCAVTYEPNFFVDQIAENDAQDRVLLYMRILLLIYELQLPGFYPELVQHFTSNKVLLEHFRIIATKLYCKRFKALWTDGERIDEVVQTMQKLLQHAQRMRMLTPKAYEVMQHIKQLITTSDAPAVVERPACQAFAQQLDCILNDKQEESKTVERVDVEIYPKLCELLVPATADNVHEEAKEEVAVADDTAHQRWAKHKYSNVVEYIHRQKQLLREDFLIPLQECVNVLKKTGSFESMPQPMSLHRDVCIVLNSDFINANRHEMLFVDLLGSQRNDGNEDGAEEQLEKNTRKRVNAIKTGALLCFSTSTQFENLILATVTYTDGELLQLGYIGIEIVRQYNIGSIYNRQFIMFETPAFFEPYHNVYNYLSNCELSLLPMQRYIVDGETNVLPPRYLTSQTCYKYESETFQPLQVMSSLPKQLPLNPSQMSAYRSALCQELCLIQGPPGTGKTHLSVHLVRTLIANANTPIVLITYTNESLDKFLLKLAVYTKNILRFGSQTRHPEIAKFNVRFETTDASLTNPPLKKLYFNISQEFKKKFQALQVMHTEFDGTEVSYQRILIAQSAVREVCEKLNCIRIMFQYYAARHAAVIAMTTTCAAKTNFLFRLLQSRIVICEEAAEILESHVLACLTPYTQHIIMIGDHLQLQPYTSSYRHSRTCELNMSLFERLVRQNLQLSILNTQYRMRPSIADLICPVIYADLKNADVVNTYPVVRKMHKNVYFYTHEQFESKSEHECSLYNNFEIKEIVKLTKHLVEVARYAAEDIVILSPYAKQIEFIRNQLRKQETMQNVHAATVDSFQGLEANIVLLTLVRSNAMKTIGFLREKNRICVALSRAKHGMYLIGNMQLLAKQSAIWRAVKEKLELQEAIGSGFPYE